MSGIIRTLAKAIPSEIGGGQHGIVLGHELKSSMWGEKQLGLHKKPPVTLLQPTPGDPNIANDQARQAALAAQASGRAATILSQPNSDSLGG